MFKYIWLLTCNLLVVIFVYEHKPVYHSFLQFRELSCVYLKWFFSEESVYQTGMMMRWWVLTQTCFLTIYISAPGASMVVCSTFYVLRSTIFNINSNMRQAVHKPSRKRSPPKPRALYFYELCHVWNQICSTVLNWHSRLQVKSIFSSIKIARVWLVLLIN